MKVQQADFEQVTKMQVEKVAAIEKTVTGHIVDTKDRMGKQGALFQKVKESLR